MESIVTSLETSERLKAAGFPQALYCWAKTDYGLSYITVANDTRLGHECVLVGPAPSAQEIVDQLGAVQIKHVLIPLANGMLDQYQVGFDLYHIDPRKDESVVASTMAEALALLWLKPKETNSAED